jgi:hypothetical protein
MQWCYCNYNQLYDHLHSISIPYSFIIFHLLTLIQKKNYSKIDILKKINLSPNNSISYKQKKPKIIEKNKNKNH